jgi:hypothetical protein
MPVVPDVYRMPNGSEGRTGAGWAGSKASSSLKLICRQGESAIRVAVPHTTTVSSAESLPLSSASRGRYCPSMTSTRASLCSST